MGTSYQNIFSHYQTFFNNFIRVQVANIVLRLCTQVKAQCHSFYYQYYWKKKTWTNLQQNLSKITETCNLREVQTFFNSVFSIKICILRPIHNIVYCLYKQYCRQMNEKKESKVMRAFYFFEKFYKSLKRNFKF